MMVFLLVRDLSRLTGIDVLFGEAEVRESDVAVAIHKDVLELEISMDDPARMKIFKSEHDFRTIEASTLFAEKTLLRNKHNPLKFSHSEPQTSTGVHELGVLVLRHDRIIACVGARLSF